MDRVFKAWQAVSGALAIRCAERGFVPIEEEAHPEAFGSRYALFGRDAVGMRLIWDGKEEWFLVESTQDRTTQPPNARWQEVALVRFPIRDVTQDEKTVLSGIMPSVETLLASFKEDASHPVVDLEGFYRSIRCLAVRLRSEGYAHEADRLGLLMSCAWTTGSELIGELMLALESMKGHYSTEAHRIRVDCLHFARHHRQILGLD